MNIIADIWKFAYIAYQEPRANTDSAFLFKSIFTPMNNNLDYGYIAEFEDRIIIAFRGTKGKFESWFTNFEFEKDSLPDGKNIHQGFYDGWSAFKDTISNYIKINGDNKKIYITGHSRGGALCSLCARHIAKNLKMPCCNLAFAPPKQGNKEYRDEFNLLPIDSTNIINGYDIVPNVPFYDLGFRDVGKTLHLSQPWWHKWFHEIRDHYPENYTKAIFNYSKEKDDEEAMNLLINLNDPSKAV